jgi:hypothetical protein
MSRILYDFLTDSFLFNDLDIADGYSRFSDSEVTAEVERYRAFAQGKKGELDASIDRLSSTLSVHFDATCRAEPRPNVLKRAALYFDHVVLDDPLLLLARRADHPLQAALDYALRVQTARAGREEVAAVASQMKAAAPAVASGFLRFSPYYTESGVSEVPLLYSETRFREFIPDELVPFLESRVRVGSFEAIGGKGHVKFHEELQPSRRIAVRFEGHAQPICYAHMELDARVLNEERRYVGGVLIVPEEPPSPEVFKAWVEQSVNQAARATLDVVFADIEEAVRSRSMLLTGSPFVAELLRLRTEPTMEEDLARLALELELPTIEDASLETVMEVRDNESDAFEAFRRMLAKELRALRHLDDPAVVEQRMADLRHELEETRVPEMATTVRDLRRSLGLEMAAAGLSLIGAVATGTMLLPAAVAGIAAARTTQKYQSEVSRNPAFFLWKVNRRGAT